MAMIDLFRKITSEQKEKLLKDLESETRRYGKGDTVLHYLPSTNVIGVVLEGTVHILRSDIDGVMTLSQTLGEGDVFGTTMSFLNERDCELKAKTKARVMMIDYINVANYVDKDNPAFTQFMFNLFEISMVLMRERNEHIKVLSMRSIRNKLLGYFNLLAAKEGSRTFTLPFNFTDLADYLAVDRSAMGRELKYLRDEGIIRVNKRRISLLYK